ncbi:hypothetical protein BS78_K075600 [Paspalum vaginatum]|uniref:Uncharacterized protein n=1 Tax=Paspalum vaginatum TaxID=158149 RepID=A0A9W7X990_9POAL|nr:hypothetical protein BS78_K075600 [Paspalum vaginatum]
MAPQPLLGGADLWRPVAAAHGAGWATAAALLLLASHLAVLLVRRRRGRNAQPEAAAAPAPASAPPSSASGVEGLVTEDDLRHLVGSLVLGELEPEREGWEPVISKGTTTSPTGPGATGPRLALLNI